MRPLKHIPMCWIWFYWQVVGCLTHYDNWNILHCKCCTRHLNRDKNGDVNILRFEPGGASILVTTFSNAFCQKSKFILIPTPQPPTTAHPPTPPSPSAAYMHQWIRSALVQIKACRLFGTKPLSKPVLGYYQLDPWEQTSVKYYSKYKTFHSRKCICKYHLRNGGHFARCMTLYHITRVQCVHVKCEHVWLTSILLNKMNWNMHKIWLTLYF